MMLPSTRIHIRTYVQYVSGCSPKKTTTPLLASRNCTVGIPSLDSRGKSNLDTLENKLFETFSRGLGCVSSKGVSPGGVSGGMSSSVGVPTVESRGEDSGVMKASDPLLLKW